MRLHDLELSGNCYKARLLCALLNVPVEIVPVDFLAGAHKRPAFLGLNLFGEIPALEDGEVLLRDRQVILVYIARKHGGEAWLPTDPEGLARVTQWLSTVANEVARGPNDARLYDKFGYDLDVDLARRRPGALLGILEARLGSRDWLELGRPTGADVACYPYVVLAPEGGLSLEGFPAVRARMERMARLPAYIPMPGQYASR